jgi:hypothetical protein
MSKFSTSKTLTLPIVDALPPDRALPSALIVAASVPSADTGKARIGPRCALKCLTNLFKGGIKSGQTQILYIASPSTPI